MLMFPSAASQRGSFTYTGLQGLYSHLGASVHEIRHSLLVHRPRYRRLILTMVISNNNKKSLTPACGFAQGLLGHFEGS